MYDDDVIETIRFVPSSADGGRELLRILEGKGCFVALPGQAIRVVDEEGYTDMCAGVYGVFDGEEANQFMRTVIMSSEIIAAETDNEKLAALLECFEKYGFDPGGEFEAEVYAHQVVINRL